MAILRQNRHRPDPPERKSPTKRQRGAAIRKKPLQRSQASRISGAVSVSRRKEGSLVQRLLGALMPSGPSQRPPAVRTPPPSSSEGMAPFQRERKSLLDRLLRGTKGPNDRRMFKTKPAEPRPRRENLSPVQEKQESFFSRIFKAGPQPTPIQRHEVELPPPRERHDPVRREGPSLLQGLVSKFSLPRPGVRSPSPRPSPPPPPPPPRNTVVHPRRETPSLIQRLAKSAEPLRPAPRVPLPRVLPPPPATRQAPSPFGKMFGPKDRAKTTPPRVFRIPAIGVPVTPYVDKTNPQSRIGFLTILYMLAFSVLTLRAVDLTVIQADSLQQRARSQHKKKIVMTANRGRILDRNGRTLAISLPMQAISVDVDQIGDRDQLAKDLAPLIGVPVADLRSRLLSFKPGSFPIIKRLSPPETTRKIRNLDHQALFFIPESRRFYTMGEITGHALGFVNFEGRGREGLERSFEDELHGVNGAQVISHDRLGRPMPMVKTVTEPRPGIDLSTTIDTTIQYIAYRALLKGVQNSQAKAGMAVVMDANNGEILAMVNQPSFNPNNLPQSKSNDRRNRVVTDLFEPGSTFKVFTIAGALDVGTVTPETVIDIEYGKTRVADRIITDFHRGARYHTVSQVLQRSSNVGAAKIGLELGNDHLERYIRKFGFGAPTGIELPSDPSGSIPNISHYLKVGLATRSYGYGVTTTPLHITVAFTAAINGGIYYPPTLIKGKMVDGVVVPVHKPQPHRVISEETSKQLRKILQSVVTDEGTAIEAAVEGYQVGGKTGTARKAIPGQGYVRGRYYASFVGFVPVEKPRVVIFVSIDEPSGIYYGGKVAAPVFKEIAQEILPRLSVFPDTHTDPPLPEVVEPPVVAATGTGTGTETATETETVENISLGRAVEILAKKGVVPHVQGYGMVKSFETPKEGPPRLIMQ